MNASLWIQLVVGIATISLAFAAWVQIKRVNKSNEISSEYITLLRDELGAQIYTQRISENHFIIYNTGSVKIHQLTFSAGVYSAKHLIPFSPGEYIKVEIPAEILVIEAVVERANTNWKTFVIKYKSRFTPNGSHSLKWQEEEQSDFNSGKWIEAGSYALAETGV